MPKFVDAQPGSFVVGSSKHDRSKLYFSDDFSTLTSDAYK